MITQILPTLASLLALTTSTSDQAASKARLDAIWDAADDRVSRQIDIWFNQGDYPKAIHGLTMQTHYYPHDYDVATNLGWMLENTEEWDKALGVYEGFQKANPGDKDAALPVGQYYWMKKQYAKVPPIFEPVLSKHPHPNIYRILANSYEKMKKYDQAIRVWKTYLAVYPNDGQAKVNLARDEKKLAQSK